MFTILINVMLYPVKFTAVFYQFFGTVQDPNTGDFLDQMVGVGRKMMVGEVLCCLVGALSGQQLEFMWWWEERDDFVSNSMLFQVFPLAVHDLSNMYKKDE